jgi:hypothetical protein
MAGVRGLAIASVTDISRTDCGRKGRWRAAFGGGPLRGGPPSAAGRDCVAEGIRRQVSLRAKRAVRLAAFREAALRATRGHQECW